MYEEFSRSLSRCHWMSVPVRPAGSAAGSHASAREGAHVAACPDHEAAGVDGHGRAPAARLRRLDACGVLREIAAEQRREIRHRRPCHARPNTLPAADVFVDDGARSERDLADGIGGRARLHAVCRTHRALQCAHGCGPIVRRRRHRRAAQFSVCVDAPQHTHCSRRARDGPAQAFQLHVPQGLASSTAVRHRARATSQHMKSYD